MNQEPEAAFVAYLQSLRSRDRGALATLRHSLAFAPGRYPRAYPYVERFVSPSWHEQDARRLARYAIAGLYAGHPSVHSSSLAAAMGELVRVKKRPSLEHRFIALLEADAEDLMEHLRQAVQLLAAEDKGFDYVALLNDLAIALNETAHPDARDRLRRRWAREFYGELYTEQSAPATDGAPEDTLAPAA